MRYLGLESSCDETAVAIWDSQQRRILYEQIFTQIDLHSAFGGVVPGIAVREHLKSFPLLIENLRKNFDLSKIDQICVTHGPGLIGCLGIGIAYAQSLQLLLGIPLYGVNHLQGHALSPFLESISEKPDFSFQSICPHLGLLVSGGNTLLFEMTFDQNSFSFKILAQTVDDAAGEALDKGAKLLGFPYPGGPLIERQASFGDANYIKFPRAFPQKSDMKFSFSGLKTSLRYYLDKLSSEDLERCKPSLCASYQEAVVDALVRKVKQAFQGKACKSLGVSGGVSNNNQLRIRLQEVAQSYNVPFFVPSKRYCGDNAAMIAFAGSYLAQPLRLDPNRTLDARL